MDRRRDTVTSPRGGDRRDVNRGKYLVKVSPFPYTTVDRDYQQLRLRYPKLHVAQDFTKVSAVWPDEKKSEDVINYPLQNPVNFWVGDKKYPNMLRRTSAEPLPKSQSSQPMKFNAKVMLVQGLPKDWVNNLEDMHLSKLIKFMCVKSSKYGLMCMGGMWQKELDGGKEGAPDTKALIKTAIRCVKDTVDLDLSNVKKWHRFTEITYHRPSETYKDVFYPEQKETTVIFLPELEGVIPDKTTYTARVGELKGALDDQAVKAWETDMEKRNAIKKEIQDKKDKAVAAAAEAAKLKAAALEAAKEAAKAAAEAEGKERPASPPGEPEEETKAEVKKEETKEDPDPVKPEPIVLEGLPEECALVPRPRWDEADSKAQFKCIMLSLDGLLDYNLDDELEKNFEVSLFAELFHEMLQSKYVETILKSLTTTAVEEEALKKERDAERDARDKKRDEERKKEKEEKKKEDEEKEAKKAAGEGETETAGTKRSAEDGDETAAKKAKSEVKGFVKAEGETLNGDKKDAKKDAKETGEAEAGAGGSAPTGLGAVLKVIQEACGDEEFIMVDGKATVDQEEVFHLEKVVNTELHPAWLYFDKGYADYVRADDVEVMLHNLGISLSAKQVEAFVNWSSSGRRINYRKWSISHKPVFDGTKPFVPPKDPDAETKAGDAEVKDEAKTEGGDAKMEDAKPAA